MENRIETLAKLGEHMTKEELERRAALLAEWEAGNAKARDEYLAMSFTVRKVA